MDTKNSANKIDPDFTEELEKTIVVLVNFDRFY